MRQVRDEDILAALTAMQAELTSRVHEEAGTARSRRRSAGSRTPCSPGSAGSTSAAAASPSSAAARTPSTWSGWSSSMRCRTAISLRRCRRSLARLQIPYLKVALLDSDFLANPQHPARRLLDRMSQAAIGWSPDADKDQRLLERIRETVNTVLREFEDDLGVFERLDREFEKLPRAAPEARRGRGAARRRGGARDASASSSRSAWPRARCAGASRGGCSRRRCGRC
ncbi:MAG: DUF1631 family protein [Xanthomonadales bacterium]|nr:DUF1631 family protein [Xanthomonadales bacterium]